MRMWKVRFNDGTECEVEASWIIEAVVEACLATSHQYSDAVTAVHIAFEGTRNGTRP